MTRALDELAPQEDKGKLRRESRPWFYNQVLEQRTNTRNREGAFNKYRESSLEGIN